MKKAKTVSLLLIFFCVNVWGITATAASQKEPIKITEREQPVIADTYGDSFYRVFDENLSWKDAEDFCQSLGGHLVSIGDDQEMDFVLQLAENSKMDYLWIGLYRTDQNNWMWSDGTEYLYSRWDVDQPDNLKSDECYVRFASKDIEYPEWTAHKGKWNDACNEGDESIPLSFFGFICEWSD